MENTTAGQIKDGSRRDSFASQNSQTAKEFIESQTRLEADAREILPYSFDSCTYALGPLRQSLFACLTCKPPPSNPSDSYIPAAVCYSCSIACHGEHTLVELFNKRDFVCDCGTTRMPADAPCTLREDPKTNRKGVHSQEAAAGNNYNHNFRNQFCGCAEQYDPHQEKGTMFQCLGLGTVETGGCGEDWWHPECLIGLPRDWYKNAQAEHKKEILDGGDGAGEEEDELPLPPGFPGEDDFEHLICFKCIDSNPWLKRYAGTEGFLAPVYRKGGLKQESVIKQEEPAVKLDGPPNENEQDQNPKKRKAEDDGPSDEPSLKRAKDDAPPEEPSSNLASISEEPAAEPAQDQPLSQPKHAFLPTPSAESFSLFMQEDFHGRLCRCAECWPNLANHRQLREEEVTYEPPLSEDGDANAAASTGTGSLLERGEAALSNIDRVRAIEGAMIYDHLRTKVKDFLKPFADTGRAVSAEDIKEYFERLRGDAAGIQDAAQAVGGGDATDGGDTEGDSRQEQNGY